MEAFHPDGHLTAQALLALVEDRVPDELTRLEIAEHMAFCDECLQRYTELLEEVPLLVPEHSCQKALWSRIRARALRLLTSRYATAAAAVALALTLLWGTPQAEFTRSSPEPERPSVSRQLTDLTGALSDSLRGAVGGISDFFDGLRPSQSHFLKDGDGA